MLTSTIPPWKAEIMERKKNEKTKADSIPSWKIELLKRLHDKAEAAKHKLAAEAKLKEDQLVLDEHILKVSQNVFMRKELERKMSSLQLSTSAKVNGDVNHQGVRITRKDNVVIIEQDTAVEETDKQGRLNNEIVDVELPSVGIVSRLKDRFRNPQTPVVKPVTSPVSPTSTFKRSKSEDIFSLAVRNEEKRSTSTSYSRSSSVTQSDHPGEISHPQETKQRERLPSFDLVAPKAFGGVPSSQGFSSVEPTQKKTPSLNIKRFSAPVSSKKKTNSAETPEDRINMATLHAPGSSERVNPTSTDTKKPSSLKTLKTDHTNGICNGHTALHSSSGGGIVEKDTNLVAEPDIPLEPEILTLSSVETIIPKHKKSAEAGSPEKAKKTVGVSNSLGASRLPVKDVGHQESNNKENIPAIPPRKNKSLTKTRTPASSQKAHQDDRVPPKSDVDKAPSGEFKIIDLGKTSMDPSRLNSKAARAANEIMKESKTFLVIPKTKSSSTNTKLNSPPDATGIDKAAMPANDTASKTLNIDKKKVSEKKPSSGKTTTVCVPPSQSTVSTREVDKKADIPPSLLSSLPASSVDDVIVTSSSDVQIDSKSTASTRKTEVKAPEKPTVKQEAVSVNKKALSEEKMKKPSDSGRSFVINSSKKSVVTNRDSSSNATVNSLFGSKLSRNSKSSSKFGGGKTFVINPNNFKSPSAPPPVQNSIKTPKKAPSSDSNTITIIPKTSSSESLNTNASIVDDSPSAPKGKRKLTVDQITVIGGYVKLDHSSLAKPNKMRKDNSVRFEESRLESIYQYPSEASLLNEEHQLKLNERMKTLGHTPGSLKDGQLGKYTPKYLLAMKAEVLEDEEENSQSSSSTDKDTEEAFSSDATPLSDAEAVSFSSSSSDLLF